MGVLVKSGHRSIATVRRYVRHSSLFPENAASSVGLQLLSTSYGVLKPSAQNHERLDHTAIRGPSVHDSALILLYGLTVQDKLNEPDAAFAIANSFATNVGFVNRRFGVLTPPTIKSRGEKM
jgi:hypothetical protein